VSLGVGGGGVRTDPCWRLFDDRYTLKDEYLVARGCNESRREEGEGVSMPPN
jgi:hypothetical protein